MRLWFEIEIPKAKFDAKDADDARTSGKNGSPTVRAVVICVGMDITSIWSTGKMTVLR